MEQESTLRTKIFLIERSSKCLFRMKPKWWRIDFLASSISSYFPVMFRGPRCFVFFPGVLYTQEAERDPDRPNRYILHSILVHSGDVHGGHYFAYIRPNGTDWCKFNDDIVTQASFVSFSFYTKKYGVWGN